MDKCNCFDEKLAKVKEVVSEKIPDTATEIDINWDGTAYILSRSDYSPVNPKVNVAYRKQKANGEPAKNIRKEQISILASHCMFCGRKYGEERANG